MGSLEAAITELTHNYSGQNPSLDYFSWGRDKRHKVDDTESLPINPSQVIKNLVSNNAIQRAGSVFRRLRCRDSSRAILSEFRKHYSSFDDTYQMMSDQYSRHLFAELIFIKLVGEKGLRLSSFTQDFVDSYEVASEKLLQSDDRLPIYSWDLRKISLARPKVTFFTVPTVLNLHLSGRLYRYQNGDVLIGVTGGDVVIDAGVGWGDTTVYLTAITSESPGGHVYAFDILQEGMDALLEQLKENPAINNLTPSLIALSDKDGELVSISAPSPGAKITNKKTGRTIETITIDTFSNQRNLEKVDFIKMDIEGSEIPALIGATHTIKQHKPKLAISAYHKWDDLLLIPQLIHNIREDYKYYLDCTTGFGGEAVLFCD